jgi:ribosomal protein S18 acetylase RimI-like enzyme
MAKLLATVADERFDAVYAIYASSIAVRERKSKAQLAAMLSQPNYLFLLDQKGDAVRCFSISFVGIKDSFCLLEYMAVDPGFRGGGAGSELFRQTLKTLRDEYGAMPVLLEVDSDRQSSPDREIRRRRQNFYRRLGCHRIADCAYLLPLPGEEPPPEMDLFVYVSEPIPSIPRHTLRQWLRVIYRDVYHRSPDGSDIEKMLRDVSDPIELV